MPKIERYCDTREFYGAIFITEFGYFANRIRSMAKQKKGICPLKYLLRIGKRSPERKRKYDFFQRQKCQKIKSKTLSKTPAKRTQQRGGGLGGVDFFNVLKLRKIKTSRSPLFFADSMPRFAILTNNLTRSAMTLKSSTWKGENVVLLPHEISEEKRKLLLTELAQIFYDLSCQFRKQSTTAPTPFFGPSKQEAKVE